MADFSTILPNAQARLKRRPPKQWQQEGQTQAPQTPPATLPPQAAAPASAPQAPAPPAPAAPQASQAPEAPPKPPTYGVGGLQPAAPAPAAPPAAPAPTAAPAPAPPGQPTPLPGPTNVPTLDDVQHSAVGTSPGGPPPGQIQIGAAGGGTGSPIYGPDPNAGKPKKNKGMLGKGGGQNEQPTISETTPPPQPAGPPGPDGDNGYVGPGIQMEPGMAYAGGSADFNESTGTYKSTGSGRPPNVTPAEWAKKNQPGGAAPPEQAITQGPASLGSTGWQENDPNNFWGGLI